MQKWYKYLSTILLPAAILAVFGLKNLVFAQTLAINEPGFDPNRVLADADIFDVEGMNKQDLIDFLKNKGALAYVKVTDIDGQEKTAADVIWRVANSYKINPKYLLVLLQKEQSLVEDPDPSQKQLDWATGYAVCDSCSMNDPDVLPFKGFANQLEWAAKQHREKYLLQLLTTGSTISGKGIGISMIVDGMTVIPANHATAMLYTYTPHINGNYNLWKIWRQWYSLTYPNGSLVRGKPSGKAYLISVGRKRLFTSETVLLSMADPEKILEVDDSELTRYPDGEPVRFPKYSLLKNPEGHIYLLASEGKRHIANMAAFKKFGFLEEEVIDVEDEDLEDIPDIDPITEATDFPQGALVKAPDSPTVWYVEAGVKHALLDEVFLKLYFSRRPIKQMAQKDIDSYNTGEPYKLHEGELVRSQSEPAVYVVEQANIHPILSADVFEKLGWKWQNVVTVPDRVIALYNTADPILTPPEDDQEVSLSTAN